MPFEKTGIDVVIQNQIAGQQAFAEEKAALEGMGGHLANVQTLTLGHNKAVKEGEEQLSRHSKQLKDGEEAMHHWARGLGYGQEGVDALSTKLGALQGLMGTGNIAMIGAAGAATVFAGGLIEVGKAAVENAEHQEQATLALEQAYTVAGLKLDDYRGSINNWVESNRRFISNQYEAETGFATLTRAGLDQKQVMEAMNVALDLSAVKHISLGEAVDIVNKAAHGMARGVRDLGIDLKELTNDDATLEKATKDVTKAQAEQTKASDELSKAQRSLQKFEDGLHAKRIVTKVDLDHEQDLKRRVQLATDNLATANTNLAAAQNGALDATAKLQRILDELAGKTHNGREATTKLTQAQNDLNKTWQDMTETWGPGLVEAMRLAAVGANDFLKASKAVGDVTMPLLNDALVPLALELATVEVKFQRAASAASPLFQGIGSLSGAVSGLVGNLSRLPSWLTGGQSPPSFGSGGGGGGFGGDSGGGGFGGGGIGGGDNFAYANGGDFPAGQTMLVGEAGPELVRFNRGGTVVPNDRIGGGAPTININVTVNAQTNDDSDEIARKVSRAIAQSVGRHGTFLS